MKNRKQMLADFYLDLLAISPTDPFRREHIGLYIQVNMALCKELQSNAETIQSIFERMAGEDAK